MKKRMAYSFYRIERTDVLEITTAWKNLKFVNEGWRGLGQALVGGYGHFGGVTK